MWKDESFGIPNRALLNLSPDKDSSDAHEAASQREFLAQFKIYDETFSRQLSVDEFPILELCRSEQPFQNRRVGMRHPKTGEKLYFDIHGETIRGEAGDFLGGLIIFNDVTEMNNRLAAQIRENAEQFDTIANGIPPMVWTTTPTGWHDWFSQRWYDFTGLTEDESIGEGWRLPFHPDDMPETGKRWHHSLATGEEYSTEYRCRRFDGQWRWMLGRALPLRGEGGKIIKWFGTCTDIHELVQARQTAKSLREQLLRVIEHAQVTLWAIDLDCNITLLEGHLLWNNNPAEGGSADIGQESIGKSIFDVFCQKEGAKDVGNLKKPIENILLHGATDEMIELHIDGGGRLFRSRCLPLYRTDRNGGVEGEGGKHLDGVIGVSLDITGMSLFFFSRKRTAPVLIGVRGRAAYARGRAQGAGKGEHQTPCECRRRQAGQQDEVSVPGKHVSRNPNAHRRCDWHV